MWQVYRYHNPLAQVTSIHCYGESGPEREDIWTQLAAHMHIHAFFFLLLNMSLPFSV